MSRGRSLLLVLALTLAAAPVARAAPLRLSAPAAMLMEASTGRVLYARNAEQPRLIASTTKLMTVLLALEHDPLRRVLRVPPYARAAAESSIDLRTGERMTVADLVTAALLPSANDAAYTLAIRTGGSLPRFVGLMNRRARALGLRHTHYTTPVGLDTPGNHSSAHDLVRLARVLRRTEPFARGVMAKGRAVLRSGAYRRVVLNRNDLVRRLRWVDGVKTGHTGGAGYVLVGEGEQRGMVLYSAVLGTPSEGARDAASVALLSYGFARYRLLTAVRRGERFGTARVAGVSAARIPLVAGREIRTLIRRGTLVVRVRQVPARLTGPRRRGAVVGHLLVRAGRRLVARIPLRADRPVPAPSALSRAFRNGRGPAIVVGVVALLAFALVADRRRRRERRRRARRRRAVEPA